MAEVSSKKHFDFGVITTVPEIAVAFQEHCRTVWKNAMLGNGQPYRTCAVANRHGHLIQTALFETGRGGVGALISVLRAVVAELDISEIALVGLATGTLDRTQLGDVVFASEAILPENRPSMGLEVGVTTFRVSPATAAKISTLTADSDWIALRTTIDKNKEAVTKHSLIPWLLCTLATRPDKSTAMQKKFAVLFPSLKITPNTIPQTLKDLLSANMILSKRDDVLEVTKTGRALLDVLFNRFDYMPGFGKDFVPKSSGSSKLLTGTVLATSLVYCEISKEWLKEHRSKLAQRGIFSVDMETAAFYETAMQLKLPAFFSLHGVCDFGDQFKDDNSRRLAILQVAGVAAMYMKTQVQPSHPPESAAPGGWMSYFGLGGLLSKVFGKQS